MRLTKVLGFGLAFLGTHAAASAAAPSAIQVVVARKTVVKETIALTVASLGRPAVTRSGLAPAGRASPPAGQRCGCGVQRPPLARPPSEPPAAPTERVLAQAFGSVPGSTTYVSNNSRTWYTGGDGRSTDAGSHFQLEIPKGRTAETVTPVDILDGMMKAIDRRDPHVTEWVGGADLWLEGLKGAPEGVRPGGKVSVSFGVGHALDAQNLPWNGRRQEMGREGLVWTLSLFRPGARTEHYLGKWTLSGPERFKHLQPDGWPVNPMPLKSVLQFIRDDIQANPSRLAYAGFDMANRR